MTKDVFKVSTDSSLWNIPSESAKLLVGHLLIKENWEIFLNDKRLLVVFYLHSVYKICPVLTNFIKTIQNYTGFINSKKQLNLIFHLYFHNCASI